MQVGIRERFWHETNFCIFIICSFETYSQTLYQQKESEDRAAVGASDRQLPARVHSANCWCLAACFFTQEGYFRALRLSLASRSDARSSVPCFIGYTYLSGCAGWVSVRPLTVLYACCMVVRADSACSPAFTESTPPPVCGCVLAVAGTGERALFAF